MNHKGQVTTFVVVIVAVLVGLALFSAVREEITEVSTITIDVPFFDAFNDTELSSSIGAEKETGEMFTSFFVIQNGTSPGNTFRYDKTDLSRTFIAQPCNPIGISMTGDGDTLYYFCTNFTIYNVSITTFGGYNSVTTLDAIQEPFNWEFLNGNVFANDVGANQFSWMKWDITTGVGQTFNFTEQDWFGVGGTKDSNFIYWAYTDAGLFISTQVVKVNPATNALVLASANLSVAGQPVCQGASPSCLSSNTNNLYIVDDGVVGNGEIFKMSKTDLTFQVIRNASDLGTYTSLDCDADDEFLVCVGSTGPTTMQIFVLDPETGATLKGVENVTISNINGNPNVFNDPNPRGSLGPGSEANLLITDRGSNYVEWQIAGTAQETVPVTGSDIIVLNLVLLFLTLGILAIVVFAVMQKFKEGN